MKSFVAKNVFYIKMFKLSKRSYLIIFLLVFIVWDLSRIFKTISIIVIFKERYSQIREFHLGKCWSCPGKFELPEKFTKPYNGDQVVYKFKSPPILKHKKNFVVIFVKSAVENFKQRNVIRKTWGSISSVDGHKISTVFVIGKSDLSSVILERNKYQDILQINITDSFENLKYKTLGSFKWIIEHLNQKSTFIIFTDDDCVINMHQTMQFLVPKSTQFSREHMYCGFQFESNSGVIRGNGKHSVQPDQYSSQIYPDFCRGTMVVLSYKIIKEIYEQYLITDISDFPIEDVLVYGILRYKINNNNLNVHPIINGGLQLVFYPWDHDNSTLPDKMLQKWVDYELELYRFHIVVKKSKIVENVKFKDLLEKEFSFKRRRDNLKLNRLL